MKAEILKLLKEYDGYISGQELCEHFQVSRTAVWKVIRQLQEEGYGIEAVRNRGYHLVETADVCTEAELKSCMDTTWAGENLEYHDTIDSTNTRCKQLAEEDAPHGTLVVADRQSAGKGRRGRTWVSPTGTGIWMSLLLRPEFAPSSASMLTLVAALAVQKGIAEVTGVETGIKWPNDLVANGKKICGILTEMSAEMDAIHYVVVGIGINVNTAEFPEDISATATSLAIETGKSVHRSQLIAACMKAWETYYDQFIHTADLSGLKAEYDSRLVNKNKQVQVLAPKNSYTGTALGITDTGELLVETPDGEIREVMSGEVSVRGVYGYV